MKVLRQPDVTLLAEIYAARETNTLGISSRDLAEQIPGSVYCPTLDDVTAALRRLAQERIIDPTSKGVRVVGITREDIADICEIRLRLEGLAARWAAERATQEEIAALGEPLELQEFFTSKGDAESLKNTDTRFHQTIYALCGSPVLRDTLEPLHRKLLKYRRVSFATPARAERSYQEHKAIFEAIAAHNGPLAEQLTIQHVQNARESILHQPDIQKGE